MHLVVAWEHGDEIAALQTQLVADGLDWRVTWLPLGDDATASAAALEPDVLICDGDSGWGRCQLLLEEVRKRQPHAIRIVLMEPGDKIALEGAADHGVCEALYLQDPDGNGLELYLDRDPADWPRDAKGELEMTTGPLDLDALLAVA